MSGRVEQVDPFEGRAEPEVPAEGAGDDELLALRARITEIDREVTQLIADRIEVAGKARVRKQALGVHVYDPAREAAVVRRAAEHARQVGLDPEGIRELFWRVIKMARDAQGEGIR